MTATTVKPTEKTMRAFLILWVGQALSLFGSQLVQFALIWWLTSTTGSATILAIASLVGLLPQVVLGPFVGVLVDRWNRKRIMLVADAVVAMATAVLALLFWMEVVQVWQVLAIIFVRALGGSFHYPAMNASTVLMVPKKHLTRIQGLNQMLMGSLNIIGAPLGALLLAVLPIESILAIDIVTAAIAIGVLLFIKVPQPAKQDSAESASVSSFKQELLEGLHYVRGWRGLMYIMGISVVLNFLLSPAFALLPLLVTDHFSGGALQLGFIEAAFGAGVLIGGLALSIWGGFKKRVVTSLTGLIVMGASTMMLGLSPAGLFSLAIASMFIIGLAQTFTNGPLNAVFQSVIAPEMQGRVMTLVVSASMAMTPLGLMIAGPLSDWLNIRIWFVFAGAVSIVMALVAFRVPAIMEIENSRVSAETTTVTGTQERDPIPVA
jgi:DHA3 family macrolide efflux protein-like MFS transporter